MGALFNADEVFAMAIQMEHNAAAFYRKAASLQAEAATRQYLTRLAEMEDNHKVIFESMRVDLADETPDTDLYKEGALYLAAIAGGHRVEGSARVTADLTGDETAEHILRIAIGLEKEAILFYLGLRDVIPEALGKTTIDRIIAEEKKHVVMLTDELKRLSGQP